MHERMLIIYVFVHPKAEVGRFLTLLSWDWPLKALINRHAPLYLKVKSRGFSNLQFGPEDRRATI